jgi:hypothetical protein
MLLKEAIADYLLYLERERSASRETIRTYGPSLCGSGMGGTKRKSTPHGP